MLSVKFDDSHITQFLKSKKCQLIKENKLAVKIDIEDLQPVSNICSSINKVIIARAAEMEF
jgi:hypothetical protein